VKGNNFFHAAIPVAGLLSQVVNNTTVVGAAIKEPWTKGRQLAVMVNCGALPATTSLIIKLQQLARSDGTTWSDVQDYAGTSDLEFLQTLYDDGGDGESAVLLGTVPLSHIDSDTYEALRISVQNEAATAAPVGVTCVIFDLYEKPSGVTDYLFSACRYAS